MVPGVVRGAAVMAAVGAGAAAPGAAETDPPAPVVPAPAVPAGPAIAPVAVVDPGAVPAPPDGRVASNPPNTATSPDGWTLTVSAKDETQTPVAPLTTAISTREYEVGGVFNGSLTGGDGETPKGIFEVGYQIGCGIDMSTANGVSITGTAGINPSIGYFGFDFPGVLPDGLVPAIGANLNGGVTVGLKPGIINTVPVTKKQFESSDPWVSISKFRIKIDGCVGESFVRSYATLAKSNKSGDAILSWYGVTKAV
ncbi:MAG: MspA family porin [Mycobacterium sp.]|nr:MspA family porin [Mycobacterium sp.]